MLNQIGMRTSRCTKSLSGIIGHMLKYEHACLARLHFSLFLSIVLSPGRFPLFIYSLSPPSFFAGRSTMSARLLPLGLLILLLETILSCSGQVKAVRQQCRLKPHDRAAAVDAPHTSKSATPGPTATRTTALSPASTSTPFVYGKDTVRGVNIGGWLLLEPWITPSVFESTRNDKVIDEYTLGQLVDQQTAASLMKNHWESWITEDDFAQIQAAGLNHVRIPIGYWSIPLTSSDTSESTSTAPYVTGAWTYFLRSLAWAKKHNINIIVDLHGAPGSQNGYDNSGQLTSSPVWALNKSNVTRTVDALKYIAKTVGNQVSVIELLNEAGGFRGDDWATVIKQFWQDGYDAVRQAAGQNVQVMIGDAFLGINSWTNFLTPPQANGVLMDYHEYQIFSDLELNRTFDDHVKFACTYKESIPSYASKNLYTILGEWSNAITDCAKWLNGRGVGARWDNSRYPGSDTFYHGSCTGYTGSYQGWSDSYKQFLSRYFEVQVEVGEAAQGWVFWTWKAENADEWSYQKGLEGGWIPRDPTNRKYPNICG